MAPNGEVLTKTTKGPRSDQVADFESLESVGVINQGDQCSGKCRNPAWPPLGPADCHVTDPESLESVDVSKGDPVSPSSGKDRYLASPSLAFQVAISKSLESVGAIGLNDDDEDDGQLSGDDIPRLAWPLLSAVMGLIEGFVVTKCLIPYPKVLADQFVFQNFIVLKMFMSAVGFSMLAQSAMAHWAPEQFDASRFYGKWKFGYRRVALGTAILGVGMAIAGSGPTMIAPAIGGSVATAWFLVAGALTAALLVGLADKACERFQFAMLSGQPQAGALILEVLIERFIPTKKFNYSVVAAGVGTFMIIAALVLEVVFNFKVDASKYGGALAQNYPPSILNYPTWPPTLAGLAVGVGQVPIRMASGDGKGGATSFAVVISTLSVGWLNPSASLFKSLSNGWQVAHNYVWVLTGAVLARMMNSSWALDETTQPLTNGFAPMRMAVGAFLAVVGARVAGGCTCGHGVSGTSELSVESFVGAGTIFGAAIATRCIMVFLLDIHY